MTAWDDTPSDTNPTPLPTDGRGARIINFDAINLRRQLARAPLDWCPAEKREPGDVA